MPMNVIMPALELAQEWGKVLRFAEGTGRSRRQGQSERRDRDRQGDGGDRDARGRIAGRDMRA
jgi:hypothetical protein